VKGLADSHKRISALLAALLLFACLGGESVFAQSANIFVVRSKDITSYNLAVDGFRQGASDDWGIVEYDLKGTLKNADKLAKRLEKEKPDLVVAVGAKATLALTKSRTSYPIVFCMVMNPAACDLQASNATGVSLAISPEEQMDVLTALGPNIKRIGVLLRKTSQDLLKSVTKPAEKQGIEIIPVEFESEKEIPRKLRPALDKIDALWMLDDAFIHSKETLEFVVLNTLERNIPFMAISEVFVKEGALASLSPSFFSNGQQTAELAKRILTERISPKNIPVSFHKRPDMVLNLKIARKINLVIPPALLDRAKKVYE